MLRIRLLGVPVSCSFWFFAVIACACLVEQGALAVYFLAPVAVHECGHLLVLAACGIPVRGVVLTAMGVEIRRDHTHAPSYGKEIAVALGGALANLLAALLLYLFCFQSMRVMLLLAANIAVAAFNLAPIGNLDGGQLVQLLGARLFGPNTAQGISHITSLVVLAVLFGFALFLLLIGAANLTLLIVCGYLAAQVILRD